MYVYKHRLAIRDKQNWQKWHHSPLYDTIEQVFAAYKDWLTKHPGAVVSFMQERVFVADSPKGAQS